MPPKKRKGSGKKKADDGGDGGSLSVAEKYDRAVKEIDALQREIEFRSDMNNRLSEANQVYKQKIRQLENALERKHQDRLDLTSDMSRQYKFMQNEMIVKISELERNLDKLTNELAEKDAKMKTTETETLEIMKEKDAIIEDKNSKMEYLAKEFESMLNQILVRMTNKLEAVSQRWKEDINLDDVNQNRLADFNLNHL